MQEQAPAVDAAGREPRGREASQVGGGGTSRVDAAAIPASLLEGQVEREKRVTALELFFDLVFVFAITQVTGFVSSSPDWTRLVEGLAIMAVLWFAWSGYAWLGNTRRRRRGPSCACC